MSKGLKIMSLGVINHGMSLSTCAPIDILPPIKRLALPVLPVDF
jgi:hypothetical protein